MCLYACVYLGMEEVPIFKKHTGNSQILFFSFLISEYAEV